MSGVGMEDDETQLDLSGLKCPLPALRVRKALAGMAAGGRLRVVCTDPMAAIDIPNTVHEGRALLLEQGREAGRLWFRIGKGV